MLIWYTKVDEVEEYNNNNNNNNKKLEYTNKKISNILKKNLNKKIEKTKMCKSPLFHIHKGVYSGCRIGLDECYSVR